MKNFYTEKTSFFATIRSSIENLFLASGINQLSKYFGYAVLYFSFFYGQYFYVNSLVRENYPYQTSEWLINYGSGFVRRGLFGTLFLLFTPDRSWIVWLLFFFQFSLYAAVFIYFAFQLKKRQPNWFLTLIVCSPAAICFSGWDPGAFGRKEVIGYLVLIALTQSIQKNRSSRYEISWLSVGIILYTVGIFTWEPIALLIPSIAYVFYKSPQVTLVFRFRRLLIFLFSAISFVGFLLSSIYHGSSDDVRKICGKLIASGLQGQDLCGGAIYWIGVTLNSGINQVIQSYPGYFVYLPLGIFAMAPYVFTPWLSRHKLYFFWAAGFLAPLFIIALDYGRWISIFMVSSLIVLLAIDEIPNVKNKNMKYIAIGYISVWGIPHSFPGGNDIPIVSLIMIPVKYFTKFTL